MYMYMPSIDTGEVWAQPNVHVVWCSMVQCGSGVVLYGSGVAQWVWFGAVGIQSTINHCLFGVQTSTITQYNPYRDVLYKRE